MCVNTSMCHYFLFAFTHTSDHVLMELKFCQTLGDNFHRYTSAGNNFYFNVEDVRRLRLPRSLCSCYHGDASMPRLNSLMY